MTVGNQPAVHIGSVCAGADSHDAVMVPSGLAAGDGAGFGKEGIKGLCRDFAATVWLASGINAALSALRGVYTVKADAGAVDVDGVAQDDGGAVGDVGGPGKRSRQNKERREGNLAQG